MNKETLQEHIVKQLSSDVQLFQRGEELFAIPLPFSYPDGDRYSIYIEKIGSGNIRISDKASTLMRLSYDTPNVENYFKGSKGQIMQQILIEHGVKEDEGNFHIDLGIEDLSRGIFKLAQALIQIYDLSYLDRYSIEATFDKELKTILHEIAADKFQSQLKENYKVPNLEDAKNYKIDYALQKNEESSVYLFGIPTVHRATTATVTLQHLSLLNLKKPTLLIFENKEELPESSVSKLMTAHDRGNCVDSIKSSGQIEEKMEALAAA